MNATENAPRHATGTIRGKDATMHRTTGTERPESPGERDARRRMRIWRAVELTGRIVCAAGCVAALGGAGSMDLAKATPAIPAQPFALIVMGIAAAIAGYLLQEHAGKARDHAFEDFAEAAGRRRCTERLGRTQAAAHGREASAERPDAQPEPGLVHGYHDSTGQPDALTDIARTLRR